MVESPDYAQLLRPVGQMLESLGVESFMLQVEGDDFHVHGQKREEPPPPQPEQTKTLRVFWQLLRGKQSDPQEKPTPSSGVVELHFSQDDIARLEAEGRAKRSQSGGSPEAHAISQILRAVGAFVHEKEGRLLGIKRENQTITVEYESALKRKVTQEFTVSGLYDYWVRMYLKRKARPETRS